MNKQENKKLKELLERIDNLLYRLNFAQEKIVGARSELAVLKGLILGLLPSKR